jgi:hypothetical protein
MSPTTLVPLVTPPVTPTVMPPVVEPVAAVIPQGIWQSAAGAVTSVSTVVTANGQVWSVLTNATTTRILKANLALNGSGSSGTGKAFVLGTADIEAVTLNATSVARTSLSGTIVSTATTAGAVAQTDQFSLTYQSRYETPATLASFAGGAWTATLGAGTLNWSITSDGAITGTRTTGCTYAGRLSLRTEARAVADMVLTESCPAVTQFSGIALKTQDNAGITMLLTTTGDAQGVVIGLK